ncbi:deoxyribodipyrimidine photo-lyase-like [Ruditapes philippinarum]|uniref:deoxyribodipyrimidine photo-lyase-like n=1 Tax=Ruditapes philippinarum TaxID=129788 RepID=UPI00295AB478|nr:deoxyribodipyrimidine photo-lyase-like [Ruditapes philippinarum]XP_060565301.1 deoxyribodipyrimidine photo-lyase-like [Ruditapes philippinarum]
MIRVVRNVRLRTLKLLAQPKLELYEGKETIIHYLKTKSSITTLEKTFLPLLCNRFMSTMSSDKDTANKKRKLDSDDQLKENGEPAVKKTSTEDFEEKIKDTRMSVCGSVAEFKFNKKRVRVLSKTQDFPDESNGVVYWMSRDQRVHDNWALLYAQKLALKLEVPLHVCFCLVPKFLEATIRHYTFMLEGLREIEKECKELGISFHLLIGHAKEVLPTFVKEHSIGGLVTDFCPLRVPRAWVDDVVKAVPKDIAVCQVDAHNLVPCWEASPKLEYGARTIRNKIHNQLSGFLTEYPPVCKHKFQPKNEPKPIDWDSAYASLEVNQTVGPVEWAKPGTSAGIKMLESFCKERLRYFGSERNNPNKNSLSNLSPWIHFGQISVQRCVLMVKQYRGKYKEGVDAYIEEAVIRRELSDNFCYYNEHYDSIEGAYDWAKQTLKAHEKDKREYVYSREKLEQGKTHDHLWNAAQNQMVNEGKMHGFMRMYWAKKILEWTSSPSEALEIAIYLNDKYNLDGRDPNGYVGCMWSICGIHDQGWKEREVFGKIRYMNYNGCKRKFDVGSYEAKYRRQTISK